VEDDGSPVIQAELGQPNWFTRCARMRRCCWCDWRGWRWLDGGSDERRSCGGGGGENRENENRHCELDVYIGNGGGDCAGRRATSRWRSRTRLEAGRSRPASRRRPYRAVVGGDWPDTVAPPPNFEFSNCFLKLLSNSCNNLKNFQSMKSSEFQALQVLY
jgi:hypothetical protein